MPHRRLHGPVVQRMLVWLRGGGGRIPALPNSAEPPKIGFRQALPQARVINRSKAGSQGGLHGAIAATASILMPTRVIADQRLGPFSLLPSILRERGIDPGPVAAAGG